MNIQALLVNPAAVYECDLRYNTQLLGIVEFLVEQEKTGLISTTDLMEGLSKVVETAKHARTLREL